MLSVSISTADVWVTGYFTSKLDQGAITHFDAAYRLMISAQAIIGQAAAVASFPFLATKVAEGDLKSFALFLRTSLRRLSFVTLPVSLLLILGAAPLCRLIYGYGEMNNVTSQNQTSQSFAFLSVGLFAWAAQGLVARGFYALGDTKTPNIVGSLITILLFVPLCWWGKNQYGIAGLALATTLAIAIYLVWLIILLDARLARQSGELELGLHRINGGLMRQMLACSVAALAGVAALQLAPWVDWMGKAGDIALLLFVWTLSGAAFLGAATLFRIPEWFWLRDKILRRRKSA